MSAASPIWLFPAWLFSPWLFPLVAAPFVGSFLGVLIRRLPVGADVVLGRSQCEHCGRRLGPAELVPIASFLIQRARCRSCGAPIAPAHLWVELASLGIAAWAALMLPDAASLWLGCLLGWALLTLAWIDWDHMILPDVLTLPLLLAGLAATWVLDADSVTDHAAAAAVGYLLFRALEIAYRRLRGRDGLGQGDAKLLAASGAWTGLAALAQVVLLAGVLGLAAALVMRLAGRQIGRGTALPFGPALALATWLVWLYAPG
jgi:leader peptidase (prepilin peptidase)/N-methyltransferase